MPASTAMSRVKGEFFAILIPGFYLLVTILSGVSAFTRKDFSKGIFEYMTPVLNIFKEYWPLSVVVFFVAYLLGMLIRAIRVNRSDQIAKVLFSKLPILHLWTKKGYLGEFPYKNILLAVKEELEQSAMIIPYALPRNEYLFDTYNYWKIIICAESEHLFNHIRDQEATVRLFVGMFWAGFFGFAGFLTILLGACLPHPDVKAVMLDYTLVMLITSLVIMIIFGMNIRRVRVQETVSVFMAYLVLRQKKETATADALKKNKPAPVGQSDVLQFLSGMIAKK